MTILGMQTDMQHLYFPGYVSYRDANLDGSCSVWPSSTSADKMPVNGHYYNGNFAMPFPDSFLGYKDNFKHIMLQHEAIFKTQVHELHRLYNKQKELMAEMKRIDLHLDNSASSQILPEASFEHNKKGNIHWLNDESFIALAEKKQSDFDNVRGNTILSSSSSAQVDFDSKESILLELKCKRVGKKILDLELPAYEYIDSDSEESPAKEMNLSEVPSDHVKSSDEKAKCFVDLNEPVKLEETDSEEIRHQDFPGTVNSQLELEAPVIESTKTSGEPQSSISSSRKHTGDLDRTPTIVQALPCSKSALLLKGRSKRRAYRHNSCYQIDPEDGVNANNPDVKLSREMDLDCSSMPDSEEQLNTTRMESVSRTNKKSSGSKFVIDLNLCITEDESSLTETGLHPPESSENKENSVSENEKQEEDVVTMAAEAILSMSSSEVQKADSLYWFANLVSSVVDDPESEFGLVLSSKNEYQCGEIDYMEAIEEPCCEATNIQVEASLPRAGGARRGRQQQQPKDFQRKSETRGRRGRASFEGRSLLDWGNITRRPRGQRCSARLILGQV